MGITAWTDADGDGTATAVVTSAGGGGTATAITDGIIVNADVNASAAIAYSKLALTSSVVAGDLASASVTAAKLTGTAAERAIYLGIGGTVSATVTDGADFPIITPFDCTIVRVKAFCKTAPTGAMTVTLRKTTSLSSPSYADVTNHAPAVTFTLNQPGVVANTTDTNLSEGDVLNLSVATGSGTNLMLELVIIPR